MWIFRCRICRLRPHRGSHFAFISRSHRTTKRTSEPWPIEKGHPVHTAATNILHAKPSLNALLNSFVSLSSTHCTFLRALFVRAVLLRRKSSGSQYLSSIGGWRHWGWWWLWWWWWSSSSTSPKSW